jgi:hypothetical protein
MRKEIVHSSRDRAFVFECPHCNNFVQVGEREVNCQIFRHGVLKTTWTQLNPHTSKPECDRLAAENLIYGCGKPFRMFAVAGKWTYAEECDYI